MDPVRKDCKEDDQSTITRPNTHLNNNYTASATSLKHSNSELNQVCHYQEAIAGTKQPISSKSSRGEPTMNPSRRVSVQATTFLTDHLVVVHRTRNR